MFISISLFLFLSLLIHLLIKRDLLSPESFIALPIFSALFFYSLMLSDYYVKDNLSFLFLILCYCALILGFFITPANRYKHKNSTTIIIKGINLYRLLIVIKFLMVMAVITFIIESVVVTPPLLSNTPNKNYMSFGLPLIHHFISLLLLNIPLTYIYMKATGVKKYVWINIIISFFIFILLTQRLSLLMVSIISFVSYVYFNRRFLSIKFGVLILLFLSLFLLLFIFIGEARLGGVGKDFIFELTKVDPDTVPHTLALPYIYISSGVQNTINLFSGLPQHYYGSILIINTIPLVSPDLFFDFNPLDHQVVINFTTFIFPKLFILDFGFLAPLVCFVFSIVLKAMYKKALEGNIWSLIFYLSYVVPQGMFLFFSDNFFNSSLSIYLFASIIISSFIKGKK